MIPYCPLTALMLSATLSLSFSSYAQTTPATPATTVSTLDASAQAMRYKLAHDSLMSRVREVRNQATTRSGRFEATQGTMGGLHRKVVVYTGSTAASTPEGGRVSALVMRQKIKHRFGHELKKVVYYDVRKRVVLKERYEKQLLTRLELFEYKPPLNSPVASWLFVRGNYLRHTTSPFLMAYKNQQRKHYYFSPLPTSE